LPGRNARNQEAIELDTLHGEHLGWRDATEFAGQCLRRDFGEAQLAARQRQPRQADRGFFRVQREQHVVGLVVEQRRIGERARRDDARHLSLDRPLGGMRIPDLLADRD